ncbi:MAG: type IV pilus modification PilV family protein [Minisyncoccia bacterium]
MIGNNFLKNKKGFTLVELLTAITIFSISIVGFLNLFSWSIKYQRESLIEGYLIDSTSYFFDYLTRSLRMAQKDIQGSCTGNARLNYFVSDDLKRIKFLNSKGECIEFYLESNNLKISKSEISLPLLPQDIILEDIKFFVSGQLQEDNLQPKITISAKIKNNENPPKVFYVQTTISQRQLDVQY